MQVLVEKHVNDIMYENSRRAMTLSPPLYRRPWLLPMCYIITLETKTIITMLLREFFPLFHRLIDNLLVISCKGVGRKISREAIRKNQTKK